MNTPWIESHVALAQHPKTRRLARLLGESIPATIGHLHLLWYWAMQYEPDGDLGRWEAEEIAVGAMWDGDPGMFIGALKTARFVDPDDHLHDWHDYAGKWLERRAKDAERKRQERNRASAVRPSDGRRMSDATVPNLTVPYQDQAAAYNSARARDPDPEPVPVGEPVAATPPPPPPPEPEPLSDPEPAPPSEQEREWLDALRSTPGYEYEPATDLAFVRELAKNHSPPVICRGLTDFKRAMPAKARGQPRAQAGNYVLAAERMAAEDAARPPPHRNGKHPPPVAVVPPAEELFDQWEREREQKEPAKPPGPGPPAAAR